MEPPKPLPTLIPLQLHRFSVDTHYWDGKGSPITVDYMSMYMVETICLHHIVRLTQGSLC